MLVSVRREPLLTELTHPVALAVPIYRYRHDLRDNAGPLLLNMTVLAACALFVWPVIGAALGLPTDQALAFVGRFMSAPLAIELEEGVNGNVSLTVVLVCVPRAARMA